MSWQLLSQASTQNSGRPRWFEVRIFNSVKEDGTRYRIEMIGKSSMAHETDRIRTETTTSPHAVIDFLAMGEPHNRYIPKVSRKALHEAADKDSALGDALDDFDTVVSH